MKRKKDKQRSNQSVKHFPTYADWLKSYCKDHPEAFVKDSYKMIEYCFELDEILPKKYGWRYSSALLKQIEGINDLVKINQIYWTDIARNIEAYSTTTFWRGVELLKPAIRSLNINEVKLQLFLLDLYLNFLVHLSLMQIY